MKSSPGYLAVSFFLFVGSIVAAVAVSTLLIRTASWTSIKQELKAYTEVEKMRETLSDMARGK